MRMEGEDIVDGSVDYKGNPVHRSSSGGWRSASFILGVEMAERFASNGISSNLITYLTGPLGQSTATAAENVTIWTGTSTLLPLLGAFVADSFLGRYRTVIFASFVYILGLGLLTLSSTVISVDVSDSENTKNGVLSSPPWFKKILFFVSLYIVAIGNGGHRPCAQAFGADQFDGLHPKEIEARSSFFNWWTFGVQVAAILTLLVVVYIQDNISWSLGFGIPCIAMLVALLVFLLGSRTYRYIVKRNGKNQFLRIGQVIGKAIRNSRTSVSAIANEEEAYDCCQCSEQFKFLNKALLAADGSTENQKLCTVNDVEETKALLRLFPIWITSMVYAIAFSQPSTFFTKQGGTMDRTLVQDFQIPAASLQSFLGFAVILFIPIYDCVFVPIARAITNEPSGITMLQRIGTGMVLSVLSMVIAALVEAKRLETAKEYGLVDLPNVTIPMSVWWLVPQYVLSGVADVFSIVGLQEFFYDQVPEDLRSVGLSLYLSVLGVGSFLSSFLVSIIDKETGKGVRDSWLADNLNRAHLDYFYWLVAGIIAAGFTAYLYVARSYVYSREHAR